MKCSKKLNFIRIFASKKLKITFISNVIKKIFTAYQYENQ